MIITERTKNTDNTINIRSYIRLPNNEILPVLIDNQMYKCTYEYTNDNKLLKQTQLRKSTNDYDETNWVYDSKGRIIKRTFTYNKSVTEYLFEYDDENNIIRDTVYINGVLKTDTTFEYKTTEDSYYRKLTRLRGDAMEISEIFKKFDSNGNITYFKIHGKNGIEETWYSYQPR